MFKLCREDIEQIHVKNTPITRAFGDSAFSSIASNVSFACTNRATLQYKFIKKTFRSVLLENMLTSSSKANY